MVLSGSNQQLDETQLGLKRRRKSAYTIEVWGCSVLITCWACNWKGWNMWTHKDWTSAQVWNIFISSIEEGYRALVFQSIKAEKETISLLAQVPGVNPSRSTYLPPAFIPAVTVLVLCAVGWCDSVAELHREALSTPNINLPCINKILKLHQNAVCFQLQVLNSSFFIFSANFTSQWHSSGTWWGQVKQKYSKKKKKTLLRVIAHKVHTDHKKIHKTGPVQLDCEYSLLGTLFDQNTDPYQTFDPWFSVWKRLMFSFTYFMLKVSENIWQAFQSDRVRSVQFLPHDIIYYIICHVYWTYKYFFINVVISHIVYT